MDDIASEHALWDEFRAKDRRRRNSYGLWALAFLIIFFLGAWIYSSSKTNDLKENGVPVKGIVLKNSQYSSSERPLRRYGSGLNSQNTQTNIEYEYNINGETIKGNTIVDSWSNSSSLKAGESADIVYSSKNLKNSILKSEL